MKLWSKANTSTSKLVEQFTVGRDKEFDLLLAPFDVLGSIAHTKMLATVGLLSDADADLLVQELQLIYEKTIAPDFLFLRELENQEQLFFRKLIVILAQVSLYQNHSINQQWQAF